MRPAERVAREFHEIYNTLGEKLGWMRQSWDDLPDERRGLLLTTFERLLSTCITSTFGDTYIQVWDPPIEVINSMTLDHDLENRNVGVTAYDEHGELLWDWLPSAITRNTIEFPPPHRTFKLSKVIVTG